MPASARHGNALFDRHENAVADLAFDRFRQMTLAAGVLDKDHFAGLDDACLAVARGDLYPGVEVDDVLPTRRRVPVEIVTRLYLAKDDAGRRQPLGQFSGRAFLDPFDLDVAKMGFALVVDVKIVDPHLGISSRFASPRSMRRFLIHRLAAKHRDAPAPISGRNNG